jgi:XTP/dITP diphosphohydrolase
VLASRNPNKLRELRGALPDWEIELLDAGGLSRGLSPHGDCPRLREPAEDGETFLENARIKARHGRRQARPDEWVAGEDSGIEVAALGGRPGVESARWAADGVKRLLAELREVADRRARYVCELVVLAPDGSELRATGTLEGEIAHEPRGSEGFGYDPIFVPVGESLTVAELGNAWKAEHSHRARAAQSLAAALTRA